MDTQTTTPRLPALLAKPLSYLPKWPALFALERTLNIVFAEPLREGEIDFLEGNMMTVSINDANVAFTLTVENGRLLALTEVDDADLRIAGDAFAFLQLATRAEDSDTLFFRRQLSTTGDTDLGLYLKNFLDGLDPESLPLNQLTGPLLRLGAGIARRF
jgi:predicted lipid carrier protein YhbT